MNQELNSYFFTNFDSPDPSILSFVEEFRKYAIENQVQLYILNRPLSEKSIEYTKENLLIILRPHHAINIVSLEHDIHSEEFEEIMEDFKEDLGYTAKKFGYIEVIGRPKVWSKHLQYHNFSELGFIYNSFIEEFFKNTYKKSPEDQRNIELLISLFTGSINDIKQVGMDVPKTLLQKVKNKIVLFDGDQTRFIYENLEQKVVKIQGLAGTGKTELLLHRLKELYTDNDSNKIAFTCHNTILANRLKSRVPEFFDFMKVEEQIKWNQRLWVFHGWGSQKDINNPGLYALICSQYNLPYYNFSQCSFSDACKRTLTYVKELEEKNGLLEPYFDYILIDEAQDFPDDFIELCKKVTKTTLYIAGDIFQDIFDVQKLMSEPDFSLNKVYRTHPKNLMFAHAIGMGLFENPTITWLEDSAWEACGYKLRKHDRQYELSREPILKFRELEEQGLSNTNIKEIDSENVIQETINVLREIIRQYSDVKPEDIAIIFTNNRLSNSDYEIMNKLDSHLYKDFNWQTNMTHKNKRIEPGKVTISNKNNIKGLEFPFVICISNHKINRDFSIRNTLYMSLTRSFLSSYLLITRDQNESILPTFHQGLEMINKENIIRTLEPTPEEKALQKQRLSTHKRPQKSQYDIISEIFKELTIPNSEQEKIRAAVVTLKGATTDYEALRKAVEIIREV